MMNSKLVVAAIAALGLTAGQAYAQEEGEEEEGTGEEGMGEGEGEAMPPPENPPPAEEEDGDMADAMSLITPKGKIAVTVTVGMNLGSDAIAKPLTIAPDIFYGVIDKLDVGVAHSSYALTGLWGGNSQGGGLCLTGEDGGCGSVYNGPIGILAHYALMEGDLSLAADAGPIIRAIDNNGSADGGDLLLGLKVGVRGRMVMDKLSIGFAPNISIGLNKRSVDTPIGSIDLNTEELNIPVDVGFMVNEKLGVGLQTGIYGPLSHFGDLFSIPVSVAAGFGINENLTVGGSISLLRVTGGCPEGATCDSGADTRGISVFAEWHN